jgi:hypothetical protein
MMPRDYVPVYVDCIVHATERAWLCQIDGDEVWLPLSQLCAPDGCDVGDTDVTIYVADWIAQDRGI